MKRQIPILVRCLYYLQFFFFPVHQTTAFITSPLKAAETKGCQQRSNKDYSIMALNDSSNSSNDNDSPPLHYMHHTAIKTRNITLAIEFYSLLGFEVSTKFRAGPAKAAWLELTGKSSNSSSSQNTGCRLELIEVPSFVLDEPEGMKRRAFDLMDRQDLLGHNHFALDVTDQIASAAATSNSSSSNNKRISDLTTWLETLNQTSIETSNRMLRVALKPQQQMIGQGVYELAFLYDADGALVELLNKQTDLTQPMRSGWDSWNGSDFQQ